jgi:cytochrome c biogenesis protein CcmG, thiol:disulfide interchange protein DsbE
LNKRGWIFFGVALPVVGLLGLLGWAVVSSGGAPGGLGVNRVFGRVDVEDKPASDFNLELLEGGDLALSDLRGKVVLVDFWASWCPPCRQEAQTLAQVYQEYADQPVEFVGVDIWDRREDALEYINNYNVPYPNGIDEKGTILIDYGVTGIPEKFIIDQNGVLRQKLVGPTRPETLQKILDELLASNPPDASGPATGSY